MSTAALTYAKRHTNDELYTRYCDIDKELAHYSEYFDGAHVYCNCDGQQSMFVKYFQNNYKKLNLHSAISTCVAPDPSVNLIRPDGSVAFQLRGTGAYDSDECVRLLHNSDIVVTNPPFSKFRHYLNLLVESGKKFIIVAPLLALQYKNVFPLIQQRRIWVGHNEVKLFINPQGQEKHITSIWLTNIGKPSPKELTLTRSYYGNEDCYPKYDNYDAIEVSKVANIPLDYSGLMGVPITFAQYWNPEHFTLHSETHYLPVKKLLLNGKEKFSRLIIQNKHPQELCSTFAA